MKISGRAMIAVLLACGVAVPVLSPAQAADPRPGMSEWERPVPRPPTKPGAESASGDATAGKTKAGACLACHRSERPASFVPFLQGQPYDYLYRQMDAFRTRNRKDARTQTRTAGDMHLATSALSVIDMRDLARYFSEQAPMRARFQADPARVASGRARIEAMQCAACHGARFSGAGRVGRLAGQHPDYIADQFNAIKAGRRPHPADAALRELSAEDIEAIAQYVGQLP